MADQLITIRKRGITPMHGVAFGGLGAVAFLLLAMGIPTVFLIFLGLISYFSWKAFSSLGDSANRPIFEFYLMCDRILSSKRGSAYGFEINESIDKGEHIRLMMPDPPPLVLFGLSELYKMRSEFTAASDCMAAAVDADGQLALHDEPSDELREHVSSLRRIELAPDDAPSLNAAIRRLERKFRKAVSERSTAVDFEPRPLLVSDDFMEEETGESGTSIPKRQTISDVLHDIYDRP